MRPHRPMTALGVLLAASLPSTGADVPDDFHIRYAMPPTPSLSCGVDSLYVCARLSGADGMSLAALERDLHSGPKGVSAEDLTQACRSKGIVSLAVRIAPERLRWCSDPMLLHVNDSHFISFLGWDRDRLLLFDNQVGLFDCTPEWFASHYRWDGAAVLVGTPSPAILLLLYAPQAAAAACGLAACFWSGASCSAHGRPQGPILTRGRPPLVERESDRGGKTMRSPTRHLAQAFTQIEMVVVIAVLAILIAMILPAVQQTRETANRLVCANNLKQIGIAIQNHEATYGVLPGDGGLPEAHIKATDGSMVSVYTHQVAYQDVTLYWSVGEPGHSPFDQPGSWAYEILPFLEQGNAYQARDWTHGVKVYACPSRRSSQPQVPVNDAYGEYSGGGWPWGKIDYAANRQLLVAMTALPLSVVTDGTSHTIMVGEKAMNSAAYTNGSWFFDEPFFIGNSWGVKRDGTLIAKDQPTYVFRYQWGAAHAAGAEFLFADGSVRLLPYSTSEEVVAALLTPNGGEVVPDF